MQALLAGNNGLPGEHLPHQLETRLFQRREQVHLLVGDAHFVDDASDLLKNMLLLMISRIVFFENNYKHLAEFYAEQRNWHSRVKLVPFITFHSSFHLNIEIIMKRGKRYIFRFNYIFKAYRSLLYKSLCTYKSSFPLIYLRLSTRLMSGFSWRISVHREVHFAGFAKQSSGPCLDPRL